MTGPTRRRFLFIAAGAALAGGAGWGFAAPARGRVSWQGVSLGARAQILIDHADQDEAGNCLAACLEEIERLESLFSLYRTDSAIARLNRDGRLGAPDADFLQLLSTAAAVHAASGGAFDPTVQPLWQALARFHTGETAVDTAEAQLADARDRTGFQNLRFDAREIAFARPGMALTLNGVAQGYITDRIANRLRARGFGNVLVDLGEIRAVGPQSDRAAWPVRIAGGGRIVSLQDRALATSATLATTFDQAGRAGHILDPRSGQPTTAPRQVTVAAPTAVLADALSTALCALPQDAATGLLRAFPSARLIDARA